MTQVCAVSDTVIGPTGAALVGQEITFTPARIPRGTSLGTEIPSAVTVTTGASGALALSLVSGRYVMSTVVDGRVKSATITVPDEATADLSDLYDVDQSEVPTWLEQALAAASSASASASVATTAAGTATTAAGIATTAAGTATGAAETAVQANTDAQIAKTTVLTAEENIQNLDTTVPIVDVTSGRSLVLSDAGKLLSVNSLSSVTISVPTDSVTFPIGSVVDIFRYGSGTVQVSQDTGATILCPHEARYIPMFSRASLIKIASNTWLLAGDLI